MVEQIAFALALGGFAGLVRCLQKFAGKKLDRPPWDWIDALVCVVTGAFVGFLTFLLVAKRLEDIRYVYFVEAIGGYGGPVTLEFFLQVGRDIFSRAAQGGKNDAPKS